MNKDERNSPGEPPMPSTGVKTTPLFARSEPGLGTVLFTLHSTIGLVEVQLNRTNKSGFSGAL